MLATSPSASRISSSEVASSAASNIDAAALRARSSAQLTRTVPSQPPEICTDAERWRVPLTTTGSPRGCTGNPSIELQISVTI
jgi:hypothetical protein